VAKHLEKFTRPFQDSRIPFLLLEVVTSGTGEMVDLVCRYANSPAAALINQPADMLQGRRFTQLFPAVQLAPFRPLQTVAFSGSSASFPYTTLLGYELTVTCYQPVYGLVGCLLELRQGKSGRDPSELLAENLPGAIAVLELNRQGVQCLSFNRHLCDLCQWSQRELADRSAGDFSSLVDPADWPDLLQELLDAVRDKRAANRDFRLLRKDGTFCWVNLRADILSARDRTTTFYAILLDIDQSRRSQTRLVETLRQLETAQRQLNQLFDNLPVGFCLFRIPPEGTPPVPLHASRGLSELLGYSTQELLQELAVNPKWRILEADREALTAAAHQARTDGTPLQHTCRIRSKDGGVLWISLKAVWQSQADGDTLLYITCSNITREKEAELELRMQSQLCSLLLEHSHTVSFDYNPATDHAELDFYIDGRRVSHTICDYLGNPQHESFVHPEDRRMLAAAVRRAITHPDAKTLEYRADYDRNGWKWYRISWVSLFDSEGNIYRLLGKAEDISAQKSADTRFQSLVQRQKQLARRSLVSVQLDLTDDLVLQTRGRKSRLILSLVPHSASAFLQEVQNRISPLDERAQFHTLFQRENLQNAFRQGTTHFGLEHFLSLEPPSSLRVRTMLELASNPGTQHLEAFCSVLDIDEDYQRSLAFTTLARQNYDFVLTVDVASGCCCAHGKNRGTMPSGSTYRSLLAAYASAQAPSRERAAIRTAMRLETVTAALEHTDCYEYRCTLASESGPQAKCLRWSWLDRQRGLLLFTGSGDS